MRKEIHAAHHLLTGRTVLLAAHYGEALGMAGEKDLVYMDPPYQGVSSGRDGPRPLAFHQLDRGQ